MKTSTAVLILVVALFGAVMLAYSVYVYMNKKPSMAVVVEKETTRQVVVAAAPLSLGTRLGDENLRLVNWSEKNLPNDYIERMDEVRGRVLLQNVLENEPILKPKLTPTKDVQAGLTPIIQEGRRAFSIRVNDVINVAGFATPGTIVDVLVTGVPTNSNRGPQTKTILQGIPILTAGQQIERNPDGKPIANINVVTLHVTPEEAEKLSLASQEGKIQLALRNPIDKKVENTTGVEFTSLFKGVAPAPAKPRARKPAPAPVKAAAEVAPPPKPAYTMEVLSGGARKKYEF